MAVADVIRFENNNCNPAGAGEPIDALVTRLRNVRRRIERWMPSSHSMALWSTDYSEVFTAATRLEATVGELDSQLEGCGGDLSVSELGIRTLLDKLEARTSEFEQSVVRNAAVA